MALPLPPPKRPPRPPAFLGAGSGAFGLDPNDRPPKGEDFFSSFFGATVFFFFWKSPALVTTRVLADPAALAPTGWRATMPLLPTIAISIAYPRGVQ